MGPELAYLCLLWAASPSEGLAAIMRRQPKGMLEGLTDDWFQRLIRQLTVNPSSETYRQVPGPKKNIIFFHSLGLSLDEIVWMPTGG